MPEFIGCKSLEVKLEVAVLAIGSFMVWKRGRSREGYFWDYTMTVFSEIRSHKIFSIWVTKNNCLESGGLGHLSYCVWMGVGKVWNIDGVKGSLAWWKETEGWKEWGGIKGGERCMRKEIQMRIGWLCSTCVYCASSGVCESTWDGGWACILSAIPFLAWYCSLSLLREQAMTYPLSVNSLELHEAFLEYNSV